MKVKKLKSKIRTVFLLAIAVLIFLPVSCDMVMIDHPAEDTGPAPVSEEPRAGEEEEITRILAEGRYLILRGLPAGAIPQVISGVSVSDGSRQLARAASEPVIQTGPDYKNAVIPLASSSGGEFTRTGSFYVQFSIVVDALTKIVVNSSHRVLVQFTEGRGELDLAKLLSENEDIQEDLLSESRWLMLRGLPADALAQNISGLWVSDGSAQLAQAAADPVMQPDSVWQNALIPLASPSGGEFTRTGAFYVQFSIIVDALTKIVVTPSHHILVQFTEGRGELDLQTLIRNNPEVVEQEDDPETDERIEEIIASGGYIRFYNLPRHTSKTAFSSVAVASASGVVARCPDYQALAVKKGALTSEAWVPLISPRSSEPFTGTGSYLTSFSITVDALTAFTVKEDNPVLCSFTEGAADIDITRIPDPPPAPPVVPHCLTITSLPAATHAANFLDVFILNSAGVVAKCADYTAISITSYAGKPAAVIPLVYDNNKAFNGLEFSDSGDFIISFSLFSDARESLVVTSANNCLASFKNGSALIDTSSIPKIPRRYLTITGLPANTQSLNVSDVFIYNQSGKIGKCEDYTQLLIQASGSYSTLAIPLSYSGASGIFRETGPYYLSFDLNIDALTRIHISEADRILAYFQDGNATLDAATLPQALPTPSLSILGLPPTTAKGNFSGVFLYNAAGEIARCANYQEILLTKNSTSASAMIPLVYTANTKEYFRDSGLFVVCFTINVDINTQIIKTRDDALAVSFTDGSGLYDISSDLGYFSGGLVNPADTAPPVIKKGTVFEINGGYVQVKNNTPVDPVNFDRTCIVYLYAVPKTGEVAFEYSATAPSWTPAKRGYYSGNSRALYKFVFIKDSMDRYAAKTFVSDPWPHFGYYTISNVSLSRLSTIHYALAGTGNPAPQALSLPEGVYLAVLTGAGGGGGGGTTNRYGGSGGEGGFIAELFTLSGNTPFTAFAGQGGGGAGAINTSAGGGAGGGGSGAFLYYAGGYLLCAGGGGGGSGGASTNGTVITYEASSGGGGAGGSFGSGGGGGAGGDGQTYKRVGNSIQITMHPGSSGGAGGGWLGGAGNDGSAGSASNSADAAGYAALSGAYGFGGEGGPDDGTMDNGNSKGGDGGTAGYCELTSELWKNTNNANGQGAAGIRNADGLAGGPGGNNRTALRGGGAAGGSHGEPTEGDASAGSQGGDGALVIYKVN
jgi:hypothetical protein